MTKPVTVLVGAEREQLNSFLDMLRASVVRKATGLTDEQARRAFVPSELTTVAGLVAHLTYVENYWFGVVLSGFADPWAERFKTDPDAEFREGMRTPLAELIPNYEKQCQVSRDIAAKLDLDFVADHKKKVNLRWVLIHMIEETARHAGHLDLIRELLDGSTGR